MAEPWETKAEALYRLDPEDFVAARNELAKDVRAKDRKAASAIRNLAKPTVAAWAINQVALNKPKLMDAVLGATRDLRAASEQALGGDRAPLKSATDSRRKAISAVVDAAVSTLEAKGRAGESHRETIRNTVEAASLDETMAPILQAGRLDHEMDAPAIFGGLTSMPSEPSPSPRSERRARRSRATEAPEDDPEEVLREARRARADAEDLAELAATARERAQEAAQAMREAREAVQAAEAQLKDAQRALDRAMDGAKSTSLRASEIERDAEEARVRAEQLEAAAHR